MPFVERSGLKVASDLVRFIEMEALPGTGIETSDFWRQAADILERFAPENAQLLSRRNDLQQQIDAWHAQSNGQEVEPAVYCEFLRSIGYLVDEPSPFRIAKPEVDPEIGMLAGPQLVVPVLNARFLLNAVNARWGSLYDALYGSDAIGTPPCSGAAYDPVRGAVVVRWANNFLDQAAPLISGSWEDFRGPEPLLADPAQLVGRDGPNLLLRHNGLHIELVFDRTHPVGSSDPAGIADIRLEAALSAIVDLEDSVAAVDAADKVAAYANWLGVMKGSLEAMFEKDGRPQRRRMAPDRHYRADDGTTFTLPGRSLLLVRNVGHLMQTPAVQLADGQNAPEGILDAIVTSLIALHDLNATGDIRNSCSGSIYIVKPKMHGPDECAFSNRLFDAIEDMLGLARSTIKIGVMDEERRTSANLAACIYAVRDRLMFINTGFLDRTGDEIHTSMRAGPMIRKNEMKTTRWIDAYERRNVDIGLACGLAGQAQIGKGMWAAPDRMKDMLDQKSAHLHAGASTAWVPSPTAAVLHATHYHRFDVFAQQRQLAGREPPALAELLSIPLAGDTTWTPREIREELDNNAQGILGYVVRWIDQGIGCSKVPDIHDVGLMEDRATLRISSQHMANWLRHGIVTRDQVEAAFERMAEIVDRQNADDQLYRPMAGDRGNLALQASLALVLEGAEQPSGYTEPLLHRFRLFAKARAT